MSLIDHRLMELHSRNLGELSQVPLVGDTTTDTNTIHRWPWALMEGALRAGWSPPESTSAAEYRMDRLMHILTGINTVLVNTTDTDVDTEHMCELYYDLTVVKIRMI
jgi:hypothetical protein